jgi:hypothetical protein
MKRYRRGEHGHLNGSDPLNQGKTDIPTPAKERDRLRDEFNVAVRAIKEEFDAVASPAQEEHRRALAKAKELFAQTLSDNDRKLFDKHGFAQDYKEIPSQDGWEQVQSVDKARYDLARAQARLNLHAVLTPAILERERKLAEARTKYPRKRHWWTSNGRSR